MPNPQRHNIRKALKNIEKVASGKDAIQQQQIRITAEANDPTVVATPHLQFNTAFARAFTADSLGSEIGLSGPFAFVDSRLVPNGQHGSGWTFSSIPG